MTLHQERSLQLYISAVHMLKAVKDALRNRVKDKQMRELSLRFFALLQNCIHLKETILIWEITCVLFGSMFVTAEVGNAIPKMEQMVMSASCDLRKYLGVSFHRPKHLLLSVEIPTNSIYRVLHIWLVERTFGYKIHSI